MESPQEYLIGLAERYKSGKMSKSMYLKYCECNFNRFMHEVSDMGMESIPYCISYAMSIIEATRIIKSHAIKKPSPKFKSGGIEITGSGHSEFIINSPVIEGVKLDITKKNNIIQGVIIGYICSYCGRQFDKKQAHNCNTGYRKRNMNFIPLY